MFLSIRELKNFVKYAKNLPKIVKTTISFYKMAQGQYAIIATKNIQIYFQRRDNMENKNYAIDKYGSGFIVADYSGKRGRFGAAYAGRDGKWKSQPIIAEPFTSFEEAEAFANREVV